MKKTQADSVKWEIVRTNLDSGDPGDFYFAEDILRDAGLIPANHPLGQFLVPEDQDKVVLV